MDTHECDKSSPIKEAGRKAQESKEAQEYQLIVDKIVREGIRWGEEEDQTSTLIYSSTDRLVPSQLVSQGPKMQGHIQRARYFETMDSGGLQAKYTLVFTHHHGGLAVCATDRMPGAA